MDKKFAKKFFKTAKEYVEENHSEILEWTNSVNEFTFEELSVTGFLYEYCWAVYASGFEYRILEKKFPDIKKAFFDFDIEKLSQMESVEPVLEAFGSERKANSFLSGAKAIYKEGFESFKQRVKEGGVDTLEELKGIGSVTKSHLAKNIGLIDCAKSDRWIVSIAKRADSTVDELIGYLVKKYELSAHTVDVILWRYCADNEKKAKGELAV